MIRRLIRIAVRAGILATLLFALFKLLEARRLSEPATVSPRDPWPPVPAPPPEEKAPAWVAPVDDGCPDSHPIKAKESSKIFHKPGGANYARTKPDRCYGTETAAAADGFSPAKR